MKNIIRLVASVAVTSVMTLNLSAGENIFGIKDVAVKNPPLHSQYGVYSGIDSVETALYNLAVDEMVQDIEEDGTFRTGKLWGGVWTRDVSYSIILSLAHIEPQVVRTSLMRKVDRLGRIIQDTGTGGAWPCSTDREIWTVAAYELWLETGDEAWLRQAYSICSRSIADDIFTAYDPQTGLFRGESSFIDWRSQSYPTWMDSRDIAWSECLGTNAVFYGALTSLEKMARALGYEAEAAAYSAKAAGLASAINRNFWLEDRGYYCQYLYGRNFKTASPRSETLGEALCILFGVASADQAESIFRNMPICEYGPTIFWPQIATQRPYHNNGIWPFVTSYYALAASRAGSHSGILAAMKSNATFAAKHGTNYENMVSRDAGTNTCMNSPRQLWSVAGFIGLYRRLMLGISYDADGMHFAPDIPAILGGNRSLEGLKYRDMHLDIFVSGKGSVVETFTLDGKELPSAFIPSTLQGAHRVEITMKEDKDFVDIEVPVRPYTEDIATPKASISGKILCWEPVEGAASYKVIFNGAVVADGIAATSCRAAKKGEYGVIAVTAQGVESFMSEPVRHYAYEVVKDCEKKLTGNAASDRLSLCVKVNRGGVYSIDWNYSNGSGEIETRNMCATRTVYVDGVKVGSVVFPQRGLDNWTDRGWSGCLKVNLKPGMHTISLVYPEQNINMNIDVDTAIIHSVRLTRL